eukprot:1382384-Amphidinium_carterae.1
MTTVMLCSWSPRHDVTSCSKALRFTQQKHSRAVFALSRCSRYKSQKIRPLSKGTEVVCQRDCVGLVP